MRLFPALLLAGLSTSSWAIAQQLDTELRLVSGEQAQVGELALTYAPKNRRQGLSHELELEAPLSGWQSVVLQQATGGLKPDHVVTSRHRVNLLRLERDALVVRVEAHREVPSDEATSLSVGTAVRFPEDGATFSLTSFDTTTGEAQLTAWLDQLGEYPLLIRFQDGQPDTDSVKLQGSELRLNVLAIEPEGLQVQLGSAGPPPVFLVIVGLMLLLVVGLSIEGTASERRWRSALVQHADGRNRARPPGPLAFLRDRMVTGLLFVVIVAGHQVPFVSVLALGGMVAHAVWRVRRPKVVREDFAEKLGLDIGDDGTITGTVEDRPLVIEEQSHSSGSQWSTAWSYRSGNRLYFRLGLHEPTERSPADVDLSTEETRDLKALRDALPAVRWHAGTSVLEVQDDGRTLVLGVASLAMHVTDLQAMLDLALGHADQLDFGG
ncbi:MAG: hypothetical protein AAF533_00245 [Acidobacteriota bacterium]